MFKFTQISEIISKKALKKALRITFIISFSLASIGCNSTPSSHASSEATLAMGVSADYPPFEFSKNGELVGFDIELAQELARESGYNLTVQDIDFSTLIPSLQSGRIDFAMSGMTVNEERKKNVEFSEPYYTSSFALIVGLESSISGEKDFGGKKIGVQLGTTMEKFAKEKAQLYPNMQVVALGRNPVLIQELKSDRIDGLISEEVQASSFIKANPTLKSIPLPGIGDGYAIAFPKQSAKGILLKNQFNAAWIKLKNNGKLDQLKKKWLGN